MDGERTDGYLPPSSDFGFKVQCEGEDLPMFFAEEVYTPPPRSVLEVTVRMKVPDHDA